MLKANRFVWVFALLLGAITSLPYIVGALSAPDGWQFSGAAVIPDGFQVDYNSHLAKLWQGSRGEWDYHLLFTHEPHPGLFPVQAFYVVLGWIAGLFSLDLSLAYHVARFMLTIGVVLAMWSFAGRYFQQPGERWIALLFGTIACGWSWLLLAMPGLRSPNVAPIEFWLIDAFTPLGVLFMPHFSAAIILQIVVVIAFESWIDESKVGEGLRPSPTAMFIYLTLALAVESIIQPYSALLFIPLIGLLAAYHVFITKKLAFQRALWLIIPLGIHGGLIVYQYLRINADPVWAEFTAQNITASPRPAYYFFGYLPFLLPIIFGWKHFRGDGRWLLPAVWIVIVIVLLYAPFPTQRRYLLGVQTPLAVMAAYGWIKAVLPFIKVGYRPLLTTGYLALMSIGSIAVLFFNMTALSNPERQTSLFYRPDECAAYAWLQRETSPDDLILTTFNGASDFSGGRVVAATGHRVFLGHWIETVYFDEKQAQVAQFYDPAASDSWRQEFLSEIDAVYVWYDDAARALGDWNPDSTDYLEASFTTETVTIYRVLDNAG